MVPGFGPLDAKIWIIGEAPGEEEVNAGKPFVGKSGFFLRNKLRACNVNPDIYRYENLIGERPPKNDFAFFQDSGLKESALKESIRGLQERIRTCKPNLVLCLGSNALFYLMGKKSITEWRGHTILIDGVKHLGTFHPAFCMRQRYDITNPGQAESLFYADITKALGEGNSPDLYIPNFTCITKPSFQEAVDELTNVLENSKLVSFDIETDTHTLVDCIGIAGFPDRTICIPFWSLVPDNPCRYWSDSELYIIFNLVKKILESDIPKVAQNSAFDILILREYYGICTRNLVWDTMVAAHNLYCDLPKNLGCLISLYTKLPYHKHLMREDRHTYCAMDALANLHVMEGEIREAKELGLFDHYVNVTHPAIQVLIEMQRLGVRVDEEKCALALARENIIMEDILSSLDIVFPRKFSQTLKYPHNFNPASTLDKTRLFLECFRCLPHYNKGKVTLNKKALKEYCEDKRIYVRLLAEACLRYKASDVMAGRLSTPLRNGRLHSSYGIGGEDKEGDDVGTNTGRLSSRVSILKVKNPDGDYVEAGTNMQNLRVGTQRQMLIPDVDEEFAVVDLWAAEAYTTALEAQEPELLTMLNEGKKIHDWMLAWTTANFPKEVEEAGYTYKKAKQTVHALNYGVHADKMSLESGLPKPICEAQYAYYHMKFPGIKFRQKRIEQMLLNTKKLVSLLGRQRFFIAQYNDQLLKKGYAWPSQSVIAELTIIAMTRVFHMGKRRNPWMFPAINTHDGIVIRCEKGRREEIEQILAKAFHIPLSYNKTTIIVPVEVKWGMNFNDLGEGKIVRIV